MPVLKITLPAKASHTEVDIPRIRFAARKALYVHPIVHLKETLSPMKLSGLYLKVNSKTLKLKLMNTLQIFADRYGQEEQALTGALFD